MPSILETPSPFKRNTGNLVYKVTKFFKKLFVDEISEKDVDQGYLGNCYFAATVAAIAAKNPNIIRQIIRSINEGLENEEYELYFYNLVKGNGSKRTAGEKVYVKVDNKLYTLGEDTEPIYGTSENSNEMWYAILEKAYAAFKGNSYDEISKGGIPAWAMTEVLGLDAKIMKLDSPLFKTLIQLNQESKQLLVWKYIKERTKNKIVVLATKGKGEFADKKNPDIFAGHAYSLHGAFEEDGKQYFLIRNPWGNHRIRTYPAKEQDGFFVITPEELLEYFTYVCIGDLEPPTKSETVKADEIAAKLETVKDKLTETKEETKDGQ